MPVGQPKPTLSTFLQSVRWAVSNFMLSKVGSSRHDLRFVLLPDRPFLLHESADVLDPFRGLHFIHRTIDFSRIGLVCVSGTSPCVREIVLQATIQDTSSLVFGRETTLRTGFPERDVYGKGNRYACRVDFTSVAELGVAESSLLSLSPGHIVYPFGTASTGILHEALYEQHREAIAGESVPLSTFSEAEIAGIDEAYKALSANLLLDVGLILDSEELLAFHWSSSDGRFEENYYNSALTRAP